MAPYRQKVCSTVSARFSSVTPLGLVLLRCAVSWRAIALAGTALCSPIALAQGQPQGQTTQQQPSAGGLIVPQAGPSAAAGSVAPQTAPGGLAIPQSSPAAGGVAAGSVTQQPRTQPAQQPAAGAAAGTANAPAKPAAPAKPGAIKGTWQVGPQVFTDGSFKLCSAIAEFDNQLSLLLLRNPQKRTQMVLGVPGAQMPVGQRGAVKLSVDGKLNKELGAVVTQPNAMAIGLGEDGEIVKAIGAGNVLSIDVPGDTAAFQLKGAAKALSDLSTCVDNALAGTLALPKPSEPMIAPQLAKLLVDAGLQSARALPVDKMAPQQRPGDYAWAIGEKVLGSVRSIPMGESAGDFAKVSGLYTDELKKSCEGGSFNQTLANIETLPAYKMRTGVVSCDLSGTKIYVGLAMQFIEVPKQQGQEQAIRVLNIFSHEAPDTDKAQAEAAMQAIAKVLRDKGKEVPKPPAPANAPAQTKPAAN
jgi:hypothetical protein